MKDFAERFDKINDLSDAICGSDHVEQELFWDAYSLAHDAMQEVKNLTAEVERLRLTSQEMELIRLGVHRLKEVEDCELGTDIEDIAARLRGEE